MFTQPHKLRRFVLPGGVDHIISIKWADERVEIDLGDGYLVAAPLYPVHEPLNSPNTTNSKHCQMSFR